MKILRSLALVILMSTRATYGEDISEEGWIVPEAPQYEVTEAISEPEGDGPPLSPEVITGNSLIAESITPEIAALARGLENDPKRIFDYVHDHIRHVFYFGSKKGAQLTLLERSGNDFDQSALLVALLRSAGHTASSQFAILKMPYESTNHRDLRHWLGLSMPNTNWTTTANFVAELLTMRGIPPKAVFFNSGQGTIYFPRVWVKLSVGSTNYYLDPAFKVSEPITGINLRSATGLNTNDLMTAAGGTATADYVQSLNETAVRNKLRDYTTNLLSYQASNSPNASVEQIMGGQEIISSRETPLSQSYPFAIYTQNGIYPFWEWDNQPTNMMSRMSVSFAGTNRQWYIPELQGRRLTLTFDANGLAQLWREDTMLLQKSTAGPSGKIAVTTIFNHPFGSWNTNTDSINDNGFTDQTNTTSTFQRTNATHALFYGFETHFDRLRQRQELLDAYRKQGFADTSWQVVSETLNVMALTFLLQNELMKQVLAVQSEMIPISYHWAGRLSQENGNGYLIDVPMAMSNFGTANGITSQDLIRLTNVFRLHVFFASAFEHAIIEQMQSGELTAASTVKMLQVGNANSLKTFVAKSSNWTTGANVRSQLSNYSNLASLDAYIAGGYVLLLPADGNQYLGSWHGYGVAGFHPRAVTMLIGGNYNGGFSSSSGATVDTARVVDMKKKQPSDLIEEYGGDPVNLTDGSFYIGATDLSLGQSEPRGISFSRFYSSARRNHNQVGMAYGWTHNYDCRVAEISAAEAGLGRTTPQQMAPMLAATRAALDLYTFQGTAKNWLVTTLIAKWAIDQLINKAVPVTLGKDTIQFVKQPDGTFTPPANCTFTLTKPSGYQLQERHGNTFKFDSSFRLTNIVDQYDRKLTISYNSSNRVQTVTDWINRTLTFGYTGTPQRLTSVTDSSGRSVSFDYTTINGQLDLTSFTDPESKTSTFLYDTNHQIIATKNAINQTVTSNRYDGFGRVIEQYNQGDTNQTWRFYWSGFSSTEENPAGNRRRSFFDEKRRQIAMVDALGNTNRTFYDGQDHAILTVSPQGETNQFEYNGRHNLTNSVDPLGFTNRFIFDSQDNLTHHVDARGSTNSFSYNAKFQLTGTTNGAGDWIIYTYNANDGIMETRVDAAGTTTYSYDSYGQLAGVTYPGSLGNEGFLNNALGDVLSRTNARGFVTSFQYNQRRQLTNTTFPTNITTSIGYDAVGNVFNTTDGRGFVSGNTWSATRKLTAMTFPATPQGTPIVTNVYDNRDWLSQSINPLLQATLYTNDAAGKVVALMDPLLRPTRFLYDANGRQIAVTNAASEIIRHQWNARGELIRLTNAAMNTVGHAYDAAGNQTILTNRNGKKWQFQFDAANRLTNTITPLNRQTSQTYNNRGLLETVKEPSTETTTLTYDAKGGLMSKVDSLGMISYGHDANDNLTNVVEVGKTNSWTFDAYDRIASYKDADGNLIQYRHDNNGNLTNLVYPGGKTVRYAYDGLNRLTNVTDWADRQTSIEYDLASRVKKITRPNGTVREMSYDAAGQTTNIVEKTAANLPIAYFRFNWNNAGRVDWEFIAPLPHTYALPTRTMTYDDDNRIATFNGTSVVHDADGNMTSGPGTNSTFLSYSYNARNQLLGTGGLSYGYDALGNRTSITNGTNIIRFVVDPNAALSQVLIRVKNGVTNYYVYGLGLLYQTDDFGNSKTYHFDSRGSTVALTDGSGNVTDRIEYSVYGTTTYRTGTTDTPFLFNGRYGVQTDANGLLYMRARYYNPYLCRFVNADPSGFAGGLNWYAYADGNPISLIDPFGLGATETYRDSSWFKLGVAVANAIVRAVDGTWNTVGSAIFTGQNGNPQTFIDHFGNPLARISGRSVDPSLNQLSGNLAGPTQDALLSLGGYGYGLKPDIGPRLVNADTIRAALKGSSMRSAQLQVSQPVVEYYVRLLEAGEIPPAIRVDGNVIVDGNHRYIASRVFGVEPATAPGSLSPSQAGQVKPIQRIIVDPVDWGNR